MKKLPPIESLRRDTPGCSLHTHLNNAGASLQPISVLEATQKYLHEEALHGGYETAAHHEEGIAGFYSSVASLLQARPHNIAWASNATEAYNKALSAIPFEAGDVLLTTDDDYVSNQIAFLFLQKKLCIKVLRAAKLPQGGVDVASMQSLMDRHRPKLVSVTHVPNNSGLVQDVETIGRLCRERETWYLVDACQSAGQMPLDVSKIGCDFLSATMRKWLRGPRGAGFLYLSDRALAAGLEPVFPDLGGATWTEKNGYVYKPDASRFEYWEKPFALLLGARAAIAYALEIGLGNIQQQVTALAAYTRQQLAKKTSFRVLDQGINKCGIVTAFHPDLTPNQLKTALAAAHINVGFAQTSHALIDFQEKGVPWALRISPHYYNTEAEVDKLVEVLRKQWAVGS